MNVTEKVTWHTLKEIGADTKSSRSKLYQDIRDGKLIAHKNGRTTLVSSINRRNYYNSFAVIPPKRDLSAILKPEKEAVTEPRAGPAIQPPATERRRAQQPEYNE